MKITDKGGFSMDFLLSDDIQATGATLVFDVTDVGAMTIQIGANQYQNMDVHIPEVSSESLYLDTVNVAVNGGADKAISTMDAAIAKIKCCPLRNRCIHKSSGVRKFESGRDTGRYDNRVFRAYGYRYGI